MTGQVRATASERRRFGRFLMVGAAGLLVALAGAVIVAERVKIMPRALGPYIEQRSSGHNPAIEAFGGFASRTLLALDRGAPTMAPVPALTLGAQAQAAGTDSPAGVQVSSPADLRAALAKAQPGDVITLLPGRYPLSGGSLEASRPGRADAPITVRAAQPGSVQLDFNLTEGFHVSAPYWRFENLTIRGACKDDSNCEHAFHVSGAASHFAAVNNTISDFNAQFKVNGADGHFPDDGLIEANTLFDSHARHTSNPVTPIDLVAASGWLIRNNLIRDFVKADGDRISYGAFAKGTGAGNRFERNLVWCEQSLVGQPGQRVGLSLGGGATGQAYCRDRKCITEQDRGVIRANLILACSDVGIYLNSAADSRIEDNTLIDTAGIDVRFASSSAWLNGNLVDGPIRSRDGGLLHLGDNRTAAVWESFIGLHPVRRLFGDAAAGDFHWSGEAPRREGSASAPSLCGAARQQTPAYGAFDSFAACLPRSP